MRLLGDTAIAQRHLALQLHRATHSVDDAGEFDQEPVARDLDGAAAMPGDLGVRDVVAPRGQCRVRALLVRAHQLRIARDIGRQHRRQSPLDALSPGVHGADATAISPFTMASESPGYCFRLRNALR
jgi:hypothetical protein